MGVYWTPVITFADRSLRFSSADRDTGSSPGATKRVPLAGILQRSSQIPGPLRRLEHVIIVRCQYTNLSCHKISTIAALSEAKSSPDRGVN